MSDEQSQTMAAWLAHPMEFGRTPKSVETIFHQRGPWPLQDGQVDFYLHRYTMDATNSAEAYTGIGMTGPITWSFMGDIGWDDFSMLELQRLYMGWYISFLIVNDQNYDRKLNQKRQAQLERRLQKKHTDFVSVRDYLEIGNLLFYGYERKPAAGSTIIHYGGKPRIVRAVPADDKMMRLPVLYDYIGELFLRGKL